MERRQVLTTTAGLLAGAGCVGVLGDKSTWDDFEELRIFVENQLDEEQTARIRLQSTETEHSMEETIQPGESYDWTLPSPDSSDNGEPGLTITAQGLQRARTTYVGLADIDCQTVRVRAVFNESGIESETECGDESG